MSNKECGCEYLSVKPEDFGMYTKKTRIEEAIKIIPSLFHEKRDYLKIVQIAALLPSAEEMQKILGQNEKELGTKGLDITEIRKEHSRNLYITLQEIEASFSHMMNDSPHFKSADIIKILAQLAESRGKHWKEKLLKQFLEDKKFEKIEAWVQNSGSIKEFVGSFGLPKGVIKEKLEHLINEKKKKRSHVLYCLIAAKEFGIEIRDPLGILKLLDEGIKEINDTKWEREDFFSLSIASKAYLKLEELYPGITEERMAVAKAYKAKEEEEDHKGSSCGSGREGRIRKHILRLAAPILGFKYKKEGWFDY